ncbi:uncharacterized protein E0L32_001301 [Thyridium curvatum]|uniref:Uncharacterized protein n=1 Tax=Thyridium curvatum TaxID=1093900 RepID=A0A507AUD4_9PEZI|nr:uncharacterized protein E0L32_001301 [Thyridium curvatum]TPX10104.1 hypothetical protein E0L32_001301 [Thyridium curvatum]
MLASFALLANSSPAPRPLHRPGRMPALLHGHRPPGADPLPLEPRLRHRLRRPAARRRGRRRRQHSAPSPRRDDDHHGALAAPVLPAHEHLHPARPALHAARLRLRHARALPAAADRHAHGVHAAVVQHGPGPAAHDHDQHQQHAPAPAAARAHEVVVAVAVLHELHDPPGGLVLPHDRLRAQGGLRAPAVPVSLARVPAAAGPDGHPVRARGRVRASPGAGAGAGGGCRWRQEEEGRGEER